MRPGKFLKLLDFYLGIPLVWLLGLLHKKKSLPEKIQTIGLLKEACLGDTVLLSAVLQDLRRHYPKAKILLFTGKSNFALAKLMLGIDLVVQLSLKNLGSDINLLRRFDLDVLLDFGAWPRVNALLVVGSGAKYSVGFNTPGQYRHYAYDAAVTHSNLSHELENYRAIARIIGVKAQAEPNFLPTVQLDLPEVSSKFVVVHMPAGGANGHYREWPADNWRQIFVYLQSKGAQVVCTGAFADQSYVAEIIADAAAVNLAGRLSLAETITLLHKAHLVISVNTGIMHLAAAVGSITFGLNGPTSALRWGPLGVNSVSINAPGDECGFLNLGFEYKNQCLSCMQKIHTAQVIAELDKKL